MGRKGVNIHQNHPSVPPVTLSAISNDSTRNSTKVGTMEKIWKFGKIWKKFGNFGKSFWKFGKKFGN